jgi:PadR family transcriptional regulator PadR
VKGDRLGEFEELALLAVRALGEPAYAVPVQEFIEDNTGRAVAMGAIYAVLNRLERKGLLISHFGEPTTERGGKRKRLFQVTAAGMKEIRGLRRLRENIWRSIDEGTRS